MSGAVSPAPIPSLPGLPWIYRARRWQLWCLALAVGVCVFFASMAIDFILYRSGVMPLAMFSVSDGLAGAIAAIFALTLVNHASERRRAILQRIQMVSELNHHIRNALELIQLSAHFTEDAAAIATINDAAKRIDWALKEILPNEKEPV